MTEDIHFSDTRQQCVICVSCNPNSSRIETICLEDSAVGKEAEPSREPTKIESCLDYHLLDPTTIHTRRMIANPDTLYRGRD
jgi:hypothetical protein